MLAVSVGSIVQVGFDPIFGTFIVQTLPNGKFWSYSGLRASNVAVGEQITEGETIGSATLSLHCSLSDSVTGYKGDGNLEDPRDFLGLTPAIADAPAVISDIPDPSATITDVPLEAAPVPDPGATVTDFSPTVTVSSNIPAVTTTTGTLGSAWLSTAATPALYAPGAPVTVPVDQIVADAVATPRSAAAPIAHLSKGAPVKGGLFGTFGSLNFWNDTLTRGFNTFLQVAVASVGTGAVHLLTIDYKTALDLAAGATVLSLAQSLIRATSTSVTTK